MKILLDNKKNFYKANLHCHSTYSDGRRTVAELKEAYMAQGYSIIAFTDHEHIIDNSHLTDENFLAITACELAVKEDPCQSTLKNYHLKTTHLNFYALDPHNTLTPCYSSIYDKQFVKDDYRHLIRFEKEYERSYTPECINEMIKIGNEKGFLVSYNHPSWSLENMSIYGQYTGVFAVEIYNHACFKTGLNDDEHVYDDFLRQGKRVYCTACDDNHNIAPFDDTQNDSFGGWVCINAEKLEYATVMDALQKGNFYASTGPQIFSLTQEGDKVRIKTSESRSISISTFGRRAVTFYEDKEPLTEAEFTLHETDRYFRIRVTDKSGHSAYTQAYFLD